MPTVYAGPFCKYTAVNDNAVIGLTFDKAPDGYKTVVTKVIVSGLRTTSQAVSVGIKLTNLSAQAWDTNVADFGYFFGASFPAATGAFSHAFDFGGPTGTDGGLPLNHTDSFHLLTVEHVGFNVNTLTATVFYVWQKL